MRYNNNVDKIAHIEVFVGNSIIMISIETIIQLFYMNFDDGKVLLNIRNKKIPVQRLGLKILYEKRVSIIIYYIITACAQFSSNLFSSNLLSSNFFRPILLG